MKPRKHFGNHFERGDKILTYLQNITTKNNPELKTDVEDANDDISPSVAATALVSNADDFIMILAYG